MANCKKSVSYCAHVCGGQNHGLTILCTFVILLFTYPVSAQQETFLTAEGGMFGEVKGGIGSYQTGKVVTISSEQIEVEEKEGKLKIYAISDTTKICDGEHKPIPFSEISKGELVTISTTLNEKNTAVGIRKGPILIRLTNMKLVPVCE